MKKRDLAREIALTVRCPVCKAGIGKCCELSVGGLRHTPHREREYCAAEAPGMRAATRRNAEVRLLETLNQAAVRLADAHKNLDSEKDPQAREAARQRVESMREAHRDALARLGLLQRAAKP
jgi:hypothetical protein